jgi:hypothetical protein
MFDDDGEKSRQRNAVKELELQAIRSVMRTENGRGFMYKCLMNCGTFVNNYCEDTHTHAYRAGLRSHGVWLDSELRHAATEDYYKMLRENL